MSFDGVIGRTIDESRPTERIPATLPLDAPNVVFIVLDDTGFGQLGCYGSPIATPNLDTLAANGLLYTNMHTTAYCAPTRSCILTGRNHHSNHMGANVGVAMGFPGYDGYVPFENGFLSEILLEHGYNTFAVGKWHLVPDAEISAAGPYVRWPLGRGFERYYGFLRGLTHQYYPDLVYDNHHVAPPKGPADGYHLTEDLVDRAVGFIADSRHVDPAKPFFLYFCPGATHNPHHVPSEWSDRYRGAFDAGWDVYRARVFERQKELGIVPRAAQMASRTPDVAAWGDCDPDARRLYARMMEVYAGFLSHTDHQIGRLVEFLTSTGAMDNTLCMVISDNGACPAGGPDGYITENAVFNGAPTSLDQMQAAIDEIGGPLTTNHYPWGWAWAGNTPFRRWKRETYRGGISDPFIVHWPRGVRSRGEIRAQFAHAIDMVPTVLEAIGIDPPERLRGIDQAPIEGQSLVATFDDRDGNDDHRTQYFEQLGHRSVYHDGWRAVAPWPGPSYAAGRPFGSPLTATALSELDRSGWELYHVAEDVAESQDLAAVDLGSVETGIVARWRAEGRDVDEAIRAKILELVELWYQEADRYQVLPLDGRTGRRDEPSPESPRRTFTFFAGTQPVPTRYAPNILNQPHRIVAEVVVPGPGADGALVSHGGVDGGYAMFVKDGHLAYAYNYLGRVNTLKGASLIAPGRHILVAEFIPTGPVDRDAGRGMPGVVSISVDGRPDGDMVLAATHLRSLERTGGFTIGFEAGAPITVDYEPPFTYQGSIVRVTVEIGEPPLEP